MDYTYRSKPVKTKKVTKVILGIVAAVVVVVALSSCSVVKLHNGMNLEPDVHVSKEGYDSQIVIIPIKRIKF